jgi:predicted porin
MKRNLLLSIVAMATTGAYAQSSVTLFGVVDAALQRVSGENNGSITRMVAGSNSSSRLGFRGTEDLGGGSSASFWLEAGLNNDNGTGAATNTNNQASGGPLAGIGGGQGLTFNRRSTVSLAGTWGELRLGRDYAPSYWAMALLDPFGNVGVGANFNLLGALGAANGAQTTVRVSNSVGYWLPNTLGGFYGQVMYAVGENPSSAVGGAAHDGRHAGGRLGYANGPLDISAAYGRTTLVAGDYVQSNIGASYKFSFATLMGGWFREEVGTPVKRRADSWTIGVIAPVGPGSLKASYTSTNQNAAAGNNDGTLVAIGYVYDFSKRTAAYATYSRTSNRGSSVLYSSGRPPATPGGNASGYEVGVRHAF